MGVEIERKFLVDHKKWKEFAKPEGVFFRQGYMVNEANKTVRIRIAGDVACLTIKGITSGISRREYEYEIPVDDAAEMLDNFAASWIEKTRYCVEFKGNVWEVDEFSGDNAGLIVAEIELDDEIQQFERPGWVTDEVTGKARYYNSSLSVQPFKNWPATK